MPSLGYLIRSNNKNISFEILRIRCKDLEFYDMRAAVYHEFNGPIRVQVDLM
jgi:hypothetical protein